MSVKERGGGGGADGGSSTKSPAAQVGELGRQMEHKMAFRVGLPISKNLIKNIPHGCAQRLLVGDSTSYQNEKSTVTLLVAAKVPGLDVYSVFLWMFSLLGI